MRFAALLAMAACGSEPPAQALAGDGSAAVIVPVKTARAVRTDMPVLVTGPGRTDSLEKLQIRAPFDGVIEDVLVTDGDHVNAGQTLAWVLSRDTEAAIAGARAMLRAARTPQERSDARRALALATRDIVRTSLRAPEDGIVLSHAVDEGARVTLAEQLLVIVASDSIVFLAHIAQSDLAHVRRGSRAHITLAARAQTPLAGTVRAILPGGSSTDLTAPVRIDFDGMPPRELNLYGTAEITVGVHEGALVVPKPAVVRDDVLGTSRVATVDTSDRVQWVEVKPGIELGDRVELVAPPFAEDARVVVAGQVGLPDGARIREASAAR